MKPSLSAIDGQPFVDAAIAVVVDAVADFRGCGIDTGSKSSQSGMVPLGHEGSPNWPYPSPSLSVQPPPQTPPSSAVPLQSSSMPLQTSAAAGLTLGSKSSQSGMVPLGHEGSPNWPYPSPSLSVQPPRRHRRRPPFRCSHRRCHCRLPRLRD